MPRGERVQGESLERQNAAFLSFRSVPLIAAMVVFTCHGPGYWLGAVEATMVSWYEYQTDGDILILGILPQNLARGISNGKFGSGEKHI